MLINICVSGEYSENYLYHFRDKYVILTFYVSLLHEMAENIGIKGFAY